MSFAEELKQWDGVHIEALGAVYEGHHADDAFVNDLLDLLDAPELQQRAATWLLKHHLDSGEQLGSRQADEIYRNLNTTDHWQTRLHLLQCMPLCPVPEVRMRAVWKVVREGCRDENKFVRAWSYNGVHLLACQYPDLQAEADELLQGAASDEAASVRARVRNICKCGF